MALHCSTWGMLDGEDDNDDRVAECIDDEPVGRTLFTAGMTGTNFNCYKYDKISSIYNVRYKHPPLTLSESKVT